MKIVKISSTALVLGSLSWRGGAAGLCTLMVRGGTGSGVSEEADMFSSEEMSEQSAMVLAARRSGPDCGHRPRTNLSCCCCCLSATALWPHSLQGTGEIIAATPPPCDQLMVTRGSNQAAHGDQGCSSVLARGWRVGDKSPGAQAWLLPGNVWTGQNLALLWSAAHCGQPAFLCSRTQLNPTTD